MRRVRPKSIYDLLSYFQFQTDFFSCFRKISAISVSHNVKKLGYQKWSSPVVKGLKLNFETSSSDWDYLSVIKRLRKAIYWFYRPVSTTGLFPTRLILSKRFVFFKVIRSGLPSTEMKKNKKLKKAKFEKLFAIAHYLNPHTVGKFL